MVDLDGAPAIRWLAVTPLVALFTTVPTCPVAQICSASQQLSASRQLRELCLAVCATSGVLGVGTVLSCRVILRLVSCQVILRLVTDPGPAGGFEASVYSFCSCLVEMVAGSLRQPAHPLMPPAVMA
jgi:hypothetical protein